MEQFNLIFTQELNTDYIFSEIKKTKSEEGIYLEKEIIYYLIINLISLNKIKIKKIYCFETKLEQNFKTPKIIFIQESESAPIYDLGIIDYFDGELTFKGYRIGINKPYKALKKLFKKKIFIDMLYFISIINEVLKKKITKFSFEIITTINAYKTQKK